MYQSLNVSNFTIHLYDNWNLKKYFFLSFSVQSVKTKLNIVYHGLLRFN